MAENNGPLKTFIGMASIVITLFLAAFTYAKAVDNKRISADEAIKDDYKLQDKKIIEQIGSIDIASRDRDTALNEKLHATNMNINKSLTDILTKLGSVQTDIKYLREKQ